jgi:hypothetical protein
MGNIYVHVSYLQRAGRPEAALHLCVCLKLVYIWLVPSHVQLKCPHVWTLCEPYARKYITWCIWLQERMLHCSPSWRLLNIATAKCFGWYFAPLRSTCPAPSRSALPGPLTFFITFIFNHMAWACPNLGIWYLKDDFTQHGLHHHLVDHYVRHYVDIMCAISWHTRKGGGGEASH